MSKDIDNRQREYFQTFRSETKTLCQCLPLPYGDSNLASYADCRIRIVKHDRRLPLFVAVFFEPNGGDSAEALITSNDIPTVRVDELLLCRRSYVPICNVIGNARNGAPIAFPMRKGALGLAVEISRDCDAADVYVHLVQALGAINLQDNGRRFGGRWIAQYAITCQERLSREEWTKACAETNMQVDISSNQRPSSAPGGQEIVLIYYPSNSGSQ